MFEIVQDRITAAVLAAFPGLSADDLHFRPCRDRSHGDIGLGAFVAAKRLGRNPHELAADLAALEVPAGVASAEAGGPYVNYRLDRGRMASELCAATESARYGSSMVGAGRSILMEHTSINPNASPHLGRARNALLGDSLARMLRFEGYDVEVHYYVNDMGKQIALLALECRRLAEMPSFDEILELYVKANERAEADPGFAEQGAELLRRFEKRDPEVVEEVRRLVDVCLAGQVGVLGRIDVEYDVFDRESDFLRDDQLEVLIGKLRADGILFVDPHGREVLDLEKLGYKREAGRYFVLRRANGSSLYGYRDIAYTMYKLDRARDAGLVVLGEDHKLYYEQLSLILKAAGLEAPEVVHYSYIILREGKMSTRKGTVVLLSDFLDEAIQRSRALVDEACAALPEEERAAIAEQIGTGTVRFAILRVQPNRNVTFDWESALSFKGDSGPYIQYSCARIASIFRKLEGELPSLEAAQGHEPEEAAWTLLLKLAEMQGRVSSATAKRNPGMVAEYALEVAKLFSSFYHECPVLTAETPAAQAFRLHLCQATHRVLVRTLDLLGIKAPSRM